MRRHLILLAKILVTVGMFAIIFRKIDFADVTAQLSAVKPQWLIASFGLLVTQAVIGTARWEAIMARLGYPLSLRMLVLIQGYGILFNQVMPSSVGGDVVRIGLLKTENVPLWAATRSVLADRIFGLLGLLILPVAFLPVLHGLLFADPTPSHQLAFWTVALVAIGGLIGAAIGISFYRFFSAWPIIGPIFGPLLKDLHAVARHRGTLLTVVISSLIGHALLVIAVYCLARAIDAPLGLLDAYALVPVVMLLIAVPISLGGWGLREGLFVTGLAYAGLTTAAATTMSLIFGTLGIGIGLLGGLCYLLLSHGAKAPVLGKSDEPIPDSDR